MSELYSADEKRGMKQVKVRFFVSLMVGVGVALISTVVAWRSYAEAPGLRLDQYRTRWSITELSEAVKNYQNPSNAVPIKMEDLWDNNANPESLPGSFSERMTEDEWGRPLQYACEGTNFCITSLGRDGQPGGKGLDYDLRSDDLYSESAFPTFFQFIFLSPSGDIQGACMVSGILAFFLCWGLMRPVQMTKKRMVLLFLQLLVTTAGTLFIGFVLAFFHVPTGH